MKTLAIILSVFAIYSVGQAQSLEPTTVNSMFHTGYIPNGFDTNDHVQVVGEGAFANTCYRPAKYDIKVDHSKKVVYVKPKAYKYNGMCLMMIVPYSQTIDLGILKAGKYDVVQLDADKAYKMGDLRIRVAANSSADDYLYAPIEQAYWEQSQRGQAKITLSGAFSNSCWKYVDTRVDVQKNVIVVQPVSDIQNRGGCADVMVPFKKEVVIKNVPKGRYLLHVRSSNAKAVNNLVNML